MTSFPRADTDKVSYRHVPRFRCDMMNCENGTCRHYELAEVKEEDDKVEVSTINLCMKCLNKKKENEEEHLTTTKALKT